MCGELETVLGFDPPDRADLLCAFAIQSGSGGSAVIGADLSMSSFEI